MKKFFILLSLTILLATNAVAQNAVAHCMGTSKVVETSLTKSEMWTNLRTWASLTFPEYEKAVDMEDKDGGVFIIKWENTAPVIIKDAVGEAVNTECKLLMQGVIKIDVKEGKYRWTAIGGAYYIDKSKVGGFFSPFLSLPSIIKIGSEANEIEKSYEKELAGTAKYKNQKDEANNKLSGDYKFVYKKYAFIQNANQSYNSHLLSLINSLQEYMVQSNDF